MVFGLTQCEVVVYETRQLGETQVVSTFNKVECEKKPLGE